MARGLGRQHDDAKSALTLAACDIIANDGVRALTIRGLADAASTSVGRVQHYFADRTAILLEAFEVTQRQVAEEVESSLRDSPHPAQLVRAVLRAVIPTPPLGIRRMRIMTQFESLALADPALATRLREGHSQLRELLARGIAASTPGAPATAADHAQRLLAMAEGLASQVLLGHTHSERAQQLLDVAVDHVLGQAPR